MSYAQPETGIDRPRGETPQVRQEVERLAAHAAELTAGVDRVEERLSRAGALRPANLAPDAGAVAALVRPDRAPLAGELGDTADTVGRQIIRLRDLLERLEL